jgi:hypothetical protein
MFQSFSVYSVACLLHSPTRTMSYIECFIYTYIYTYIYITSDYVYSNVLEGHLNNIKILDPIIQKTHHIFITKTNWIMLFRQAILCCCDKHTKHKNVICRQHSKFLNANAHCVRACVRVPTNSYDTNIFQHVTIFLSQISY